MQLSANGNAGWRTAAAHAIPVTALVAGLYTYWVCRRRPLYRLSLLPRHGTACPTRRRSARNEQPLLDGGLGSRRDGMMTYAAINWAVGRLAASYVLPAWARVGVKRDPAGDCAACHYHDGEFAHPAALICGPDDGPRIGRLGYRAGNRQDGRAPAAEWPGWGWTGWRWLLCCCPASSTTSAGYGNGARGGDTADAGCGCGLDGVLACGDLAAALATEARTSLAP